MFDYATHSRTYTALIFLLVLLDNFCYAGETRSGGPDKAATADLYVAPDGDDSWSGTLVQPSDEATDGPLATLAAARNAVRDLVGETGRDVTVLLREGAYRLTETVVFSLKDSAAEDHTITYAAYPGETPVLSSGAPVTGWGKLDDAPSGLPASARNKVWVADVSALGQFSTLYDGDRELPRARGNGFSPIGSPPRTEEGHRTLEFPPGAVESYENLEDVELRIIPSRYWIMNVLPVESIDESTSTLTTAVPGTYPLGKNSMTDRNTAWIENALEVLDEPGEWVLDTSEGLLYLWPEGERPSDGIVAPTLTELIRVEGNIDYAGPTDTPVAGLIFRGLTFTHGDRFPWHGRTGWGLQHDWECFDKPTALLRLRGAERCVVEDCTFFNSGHTAVRLDLHCQENRIAGNHIHHVGGVGVLLAGYGPGTKNVNKKNEVANNYIHHIGQHYWGSGGVFAWQSGENRIAHNHIHHVPYTGILATGRISRSRPGPAECSRTIRWHETPEAYLQWPWAKREPYLHGRQNIIEQNDIHHAMETLGDGNCIYISGTGGGNQVKFNYCHDCAGKYMNAVIRCDDDQHGTLMQGNVCCRTGGYGEGFISKGDNDIINNVVADLRPAHRHRGYIVFPYGSIKGSTIQRNILYSRKDEQTLYYQGRSSGRRGGPPRLRDTQADYNLYYCTEDPDWGTEHLRTQREFGIEKHSVVADPEFVDIEAGDFDFQSGSPAPRLGIQPLDASAAGLEPPYRQRFVGTRITTRISPQGRMYRKPITVKVRCSHPGATIRYTLDGTEPTQQSTTYAGPFTLEEPATVRAKAFAPGATDLAGAMASFPAPPAPITEDFESIPAGGMAPGATTVEDEKLKHYTARVTDQQAASGEHSLKFIDGPGQERLYTPHIFYRRSYPYERMLGRFDVRIDRTASLYYQWRDYETGFRRGPAVMIQPGGEVVHNGTRLLTIPVDRWVRFEVACALGDESTGTFDMTVWLPGNQSPRVFRNLACQDGFERLDWVGFVAKSREKSVLYIDNVEVRPVD